MHRTLYRDFFQFQGIPFLLALILSACDGIKPAPHEPPLSRAMATLDQTSSNGDFIIVEKVKDTGPLFLSLQRLASQSPQSLYKEEIAAFRKREKALKEWWNPEKDTLSGASSPRKDFPTNAGLVPNKEARLRIRWCSGSLANPVRCLTAASSLASQLTGELFEKELADVTDTVEREKRLASAFAEAVLMLSLHDRLPACYRESLRETEGFENSIPSPLEGINLFQFARDSFAIAALPNECKDRTKWSSLATAGKCTTFQNLETRLKTIIKEAPANVRTAYQRRVLLAARLGGQEHLDSLGLPEISPEIPPDLAKIVTANGSLCDQRIDCFLEKDLAKAIKTFDAARWEERDGLTYRSFGPDAKPLDHRQERALNVVIEAVRLMKQSGLAPRKYIEAREPPSDLTYSCDAVAKYKFGDFTSRSQEIANTIDPREVVAEAERIPQLRQTFGLTEDGFGPVSPRGTALITRSLQCKDDGGYCGLKFPLHFHHRDARRWVSALEVSLKSETNPTCDTTFKVKVTGNEREAIPLLDKQQARSLFEAGCKKLMARVAYVSTSGKERILAGHARIELNHELLSDYSETPEEIVATVWRRVWGEAPSDNQIMSEIEKYRKAERFLIIDEYESELSSENGRDESKTFQIAMKASEGVFSRPLLPFEVKGLLANLIDQDARGHFERTQVEMRRIREDKDASPFFHLKKPYLEAIIPHNFSRDDACLGLKAGRGPTLESCSEPGMHRIWTQDFFGRLATKDGACLLVSPQGAASSTLGTEGVSCEFAPPSSVPLVLDVPDKRDETAIYAGLACLGAFRTFHPSEPTIVIGLEPCSVQLHRSYWRKVLLSP